MDGSSPSTPRSSAIFRAGTRRRPSRTPSSTCPTGSAFPCRWTTCSAGASQGGTRADALTSGYLVGVETIDGVKTSHFAFREDHIDWQVWIQQGDQPLPRKVVIVDRRDPTHPSYIARLSWTLNPTLTDAAFAAARPPKDAKRIRITVQQPQAGADQ
ncbi:DUF2092 domain-containing protein [Phenylobacterium sp. J367]|uniref:DUF2092 domain-containing protein n=1 Tax=Phenylobacterium sp. J367 TaxID=2898435 RepID=UPI002151CB18|nr:DUF2092 domain-containing protein [Phenylobacterium sp. J367]MCR5880806.1 DUF2092 domain-containing protein [Phenylobacterium sp. J367]